MRSTKKNNKAKRRIVEVIILLLLFLAGGILLNANLNKKEVAANETVEIKESTTPLAKTPEASETKEIAKTNTVAEANKPANTTPIQPSNPVDVEDKEEVKDETKEEEKPKVSVLDALNWLKTQLQTKGTTVNKYFKASNRQNSGASLDSNGKNFAPTVNEELKAAGIVNDEDDYSWRIVRVESKQENYDIYWVNEDLNEVKENETVEASKLNTKEDTVENGEVGVSEKTVENKTFNVIDDNTFVEDANQASEVSE